MNTKLRKEAKNDFKKDFFKLMNSSVFGKTMKIARNHRDIKLVTTNEQRYKLVSEPNYHTAKYISKNLLTTEMKQTEATINKPVYLGQEILGISKTLMYDYIKPKYGDRAKLCYTDTESSVIYIETEDFQKDIANNVEKWFDTSNYDKNNKRLLPIGKIKKVIGLSKDELRGKTFTEFVALRAKTYAYLMEDGNEHKKAKGTKKYVIKRKLMFGN